MDAKQIFHDARQLYRAAHNPDQAEPIVKVKAYPQPLKVNPLIERASRMLIDAGLARATSALPARGTEPRLMSDQRYFATYCRTPAAIALAYARQAKREYRPILRGPRPRLP